MPIGGTQNGPCWTSLNDGDPLLQLEAAFAAVCVTAQNCIHVLPRKDAVMPFLQKLNAELSMPTGGMQNGQLSPTPCVSPRETEYMCCCEGSP